MGAKLFRFLSVLFAAAAVTVFSVGCSPTVFGFADKQDNADRQDNTVRPYYGYVDTPTHLLFLCESVSDSTSHIYFESVFVNTSAEHIARATITVEFIDLDKYPLGSAQYDTIADFEIVIKNIPAGAQRKVHKATDITVDNPDNNIYRLWTYYQETVKRTKLAFFCHKIEYVIGADRTDINEINGNYNFV